MTEGEYSDGLCTQVKDVFLRLTPEPAPVTIQYPNTAGGAAQARNEQCQPLSQYGYIWSALQKVNEPDPSVFLLPLDPEGAKPSNITLYSKDSTIAQATALIDVKADVSYPHTHGQRDLTVRNSAYCDEDTDCVKGGCTSTCDIGKHQCNPVVKSVDPAQADRDDWVTVGGCYFGETAGEIAFKQGASTSIVNTFTFPAQCKDTWHDTYIVTNLADAKPQLQIAKADVQVETATVLTSNWFSSLDVVEATGDHPMLCGIAPQGGVVGTEVKVFGKNLNTGSASDKMTFTKESAVKESPALSAMQTEAKAKVPIETEQGEQQVRFVEEGRTTSNSVGFTVEDAGRAALITYKPDQTVVTPCTPEEKAKPEKGLPEDRKFCAKADEKYNGIAYVRFDKAVACTANNPTDCILILECTDKPDCFIFFNKAYNNPSDVNYVFQEGDTKIELELALADFKIGHRYRISIQPQALVTRENKKYIGCGALTETVSACYWDFTLQENITVGKVEVVSSGITYIDEYMQEVSEDEDATIDLNSLDKAGYDPHEKLRASIEDDKGNPITDEVKIMWSVENLKGLHIVEDPPDGTVITAEPKGFDKDKADQVYELGKFKVKAEVETGSQDVLPKNINNPHEVTVKNDDTLKITGYNPQGVTDVCRNSALDVSFNFPLLASPLNLKNITLWAKNQSTCFIDPALGVAYDESFFRALFRRLVVWF